MLSTNEGLAVYASYCRPVTDGKRRDNAADASWLVIDSDRVYRVSFEA
jgi:hypothetical protein